MNMDKLIVNKLLFTLLIFLLVILPIELIPSAIGVLCRYLFIILGSLCLFICRKKIITSTFHNFDILISYDVDSFTGSVSLFGCEFGIIDVSVHSIHYNNSEFILYCGH